MVVSQNRVTPTVFIGTSTFVIAGALGKITFAGESLRQANFCRMAAAGDVTYVHVNAKVASSSSFHFVFHHLKINLYVYIYTPQ